MIAQASGFWHCQTTSLCSRLVFMVACQKWTDTMTDFYLRSSPLRKPKLLVTYCTYNKHLYLEIVKYKDASTEMAWWWTQKSNFFLFSVHFILSSPHCIRTIWVARGLTQKLIICSRLAVVLPTVSFSEPPPPPPYSSLIVAIFRR